VSKIYLIVNDYGGGGFSLLRAYSNRADAVKALSLLEKTGQAGTMRIEEVEFDA
jgi:hypothetical protein